jgi:hypothetical protein
MKAAHCGHMFLVTANSEGFAPILAGISRVAARPPLSHPLERLSCCRVVEGSAYAAPSCSSTTRAALLPSALRSSASLAAPLARWP